MLYKHYIKPVFSQSMAQVASLKSLFLAMLLILISACSTTTEQEKNIPQDDLKTISKYIIDLIAIPDNKKGLQVPSQSVNSKNASINTNGNAYLAQKAQLMSGVGHDVITDYQQALTLMKQHKWQAANTQFDRVIAKQPNLSGSYVNKALILQAMNAQTTGVEKSASLQAIELLIDTAISVNSLNPYAHHIKGQMLQKRNDFEHAELAYAKALSIWPNYTQAQLSMAVLLELYRGKLLEAHHYYSAYLQLKSDDKQVRRWQAALAIKIKRANLTLAVQGGE